MLHPVLPPVLPTVRETPQFANLAVTAASDRQFFSVVTPESQALATKHRTQKQHKTQQQTNFSNTDNSLQTKKLLVAKKTLPVSTKRVNLPAEFSPLTVAKSAAFLGDPLSINSADIRFARSNDNRVVLGEPLFIGFPGQWVEVSENNKQKSNAKPLNKSLPRKQQVTQIAKNKQNISQKNISQTQSQQYLAEKLIPTQSSGAVTKNIENTQTFQPTPQPIKIQFNTQKQTNEPPKLSTIEFKSRSFTSQSLTPNSTAQQTAPTPPNITPGQESQLPATPQQTRRVIEVIADRQEYDQARRVVTAEGNVVVRFDGTVVDADRLQVNLDNLIAVGEGNVALTRGDQVLRGQRFTYNFIQDSGELLAGRGDIFIPTAQQDFSFLPTDVTAGGVAPRPISDRIRSNQPLSEVSSPGGININVGGRTSARNLPGPQQGGEVRRLRFEAARVDFYPRGWQAQDVRITNDPFSPPELELRANKVTLTEVSPVQDRLKTQGQRLVFDQKLTLGIPRDEQVIDRSEREVTPTLVSIGFDGDQRGGLFVERSFKPVATEQVRWSVTPQFFVQKAVQESVGNIPALFGLKTRLNATLSPRAIIEGTGQLNSFDLTQIEDNLRASLRLRQQLGDVRNPHILSLEYSYRDRLYNGTLGFQTVQSSLGGIITSPVIALGNGLNLSYQGGAQYINARTDRPDLLEPIRDNDRISLGRVQASTAISGGISLWQGKPLAPTATGGLRYTPNPVVPYLQAYGGVTGTTSFYTSGDNQTTLTGTIGLQGQLGHFSRSFLDYTAFNISYSQGIFSGQSPFLFDRAVDNKVLNAGITQQIYGPFRFGFETSINLDTGERRSTDYILEYSRRTYGITLRYNPVLELGGISFRISDFNWTGGTNPFSEVQPVVGGVQQRDD